MIENYYIYVVPHYIGLHLSDSNPKRDLASSGWEAVDIYGGTYESPSTGYTDYKKQISEDGRVWDVVFRKYEIINSSIFIINSSDSGYEIGGLEENLKKSDQVFKKMISQSGLAGLSPVEPILLRNFKGNSNFIKEERKYEYIFFEKSGMNKILCLNRYCYYLKVNLNQKLSNAVINNIITVLSLSEIAKIFSLKFLRDDERNEQESVAVIKTIWGHKFSLLKCSGILLFPAFFKKEMGIIDNLLDCRNMDLSENHNYILNKIHKVEGGILILTIFIIIDIVYRISHEALGLYPILSLSFAISITYVVLLYARNHEQ